MQNKNIGICKTKSSISTTLQFPTVSEDSKYYCGTCTNGTSRKKGIKSREFKGYDIQTHFRGQKFKWFGGGGG